MCLPYACMLELVIIANFFSLLLLLLFVRLFFFTFSYRNGRNNMQTFSIIALHYALIHMATSEQHSENSISMRCQASNFPGRCDVELRIVGSLLCACVCVCQFIFLMHINKNPKLSKHQQFSQLHMFLLWNHI